MQVVYIQIYRSDVDILFGAKTRYIILIIQTYHVFTNTKCVKISQWVRKCFEKLKANAQFNIS